MPRSLAAVSVQGKIKRHALRSSLGVVALALSMVMAGTGELNVLRRLRVAHGMFSEGVTYGSHLATHMALGLLFLGQGRHTLGTSDAAVAALLLALYPAFPATPTENRAHLQAYRHLWVLAVEPRYLEARDVDTGEPVFLPVRLRLVQPQGDAASTTTASTSSKTDVRAKQLVAPTLLPNLSLIESIQVDSPRYWPFALRLTSPSASLSGSSSPPPTHLTRFLRSGTLFVKRRTGHLSYAHDPRGIRSIFTRSKSETGSAVLDFGETLRVLAPSSSSSSSPSTSTLGAPSGGSALEDFVRAFSSDAEALAVTQALCRPRSGAGAGPPTAFEAFAGSVLLECLTRDKRDVAALYHAVRSAWRDAVGGAPPRGTISLRQADLRFLVDFYRHGAFSTLVARPASASSSSAVKNAPLTAQREPLVHPALIDHLAASLDAQGKAALQVRGAAPRLRAYLRTLGWPSSSGDNGAEAEAEGAAGSDVLALVAAHLRLPPLAALATLRGLLLSLSGPAAAGGDARGTGLSRGEAALALRRTRGGVEVRRGEGGAWGEEAEGWMVDAWVGE